ncbi:hypothetical protein BASA61_001549 [Batrachochytrium salamandrivorans]|nr:hypothetical protein BASA61_001549 [Batrachochytrium salamandrivorans]
MMQARTRTPSSSGSSNNNTSSSTGSHMNTTSTFSGLTKAATTTGKLTGLFSKLVTKKMPKEELVAEIEIRFTRDSLIRLFHHTLLYHDFAHFVQSTHCGESLMFYEAFLKLESRLMASRRQQLTPTVRGSPNEVNLTHSMRRSIAAELCKGNGLEIPITIFDGAIDHVLALLYDNSFKLYLRHRENKEA